MRDHTFDAGTLGGDQAVVLAGGLGQGLAERYLRELDGPQQQSALDRLRELAQAGPVTLVTSAKDVAHSHVPVLVRNLAA